MPTACNSSLILYKCGHRARSQWLTIYRHLPYPQVFLPIFISKIYLFHARDLLEVEHVTTLVKCLRLLMAVFTCFGCFGFGNL